MMFGSIHILRGEVKKERGLINVSFCKGGLL